MKKRDSLKKSLGYELTEDMDTGEKGVIIYLGTKSEKKAKKEMKRIAKRLPKEWKSS